jgi:hypothetical protein
LITGMVVAVLAATIPSTRQFVPIVVAIAAALPGRPPAQKETRR